MGELKTCLLLKKIVIASFKQLMSIHSGRSINHTGMRGLRSLSPHNFSY
jgi:hypothetical protein